MENQVKLSADQIEAFYHDEFVEDQVRDFRALVKDDRDQTVVVDVGGGCGFFARRLAEAAGRNTRVIDMDPRSIEECARIGVEGHVGDALDPDPKGDEGVVTFNLILHHLVGKSEAETRKLQVHALRVWKGKSRHVFVNEYIYQSFVARLSGRLIYEITSSKLLSWFGNQAAKVVPSFKANTFGVGVRFRSHEEWRKLFAEAGFDVLDSQIGKAERVSNPLRILLIKTIRRDSFLLASA